LARELFKIAMAEWIAKQNLSSEKENELYGMLNKESYDGLLGKVQGIFDGTGISHDDVRKTVGGG
jgi:hypothetical protein